MNNKPQPTKNQIMKKVFDHQTYSHARLGFPGVVLTLEIVGGVLDQATVTVNDVMLRVTGAEEDLEGVMFRAVVPVNDVKQNSGLYNPSTGSEYLPLPIRYTSNGEPREINRATLHEIGKDFNAWVKLNFQDDPLVQD